MHVADTTGVYTETATVHVMLVDNEGAPVTETPRDLELAYFYAGEWHELDITPSSILLNADVEFDVPDVPAGEYRVRVSFTGNAYYDPTEAFVTLTVEKKAVAFTLPTTLIS